MPKQAVLLANLGSPDSNSVPDVRKYLKEFLSDDRVFDAPQPIKALILYGRVLPSRPAATAEAYASIWKEGEAPLIRTTRKVQELLAKEVDLPVHIAMRYGNPSTRDAIRQMKTEGIEEVFLIPQYPHYAMSSYETAVIHVQDCLRDLAPGIKLHTYPPFFRHPQYIDALCQRMAPYLEEEYDHALFSFHGIPVRHLRKGDPSKAHCTKVEDCCRTCSPVHSVCYRAQCFRTVDEVARQLNLPSGKYSVSFQSRFGKEPWLEPYTDKELERLPREGKKRLLVITPAFVADCLETLEEISMGGKESFLEAGGEKFTFIPCLNDHPAYIQFLAERVREFQKSPRPQPAACGY
ncbi:MAG: ferrochelatase [Opitutales bacterium]|nr:ferrochelatase [Opitutales bacterium]MCH8540494.1 ferrochelatase [Opitutales bacterium]